MHKNHCHKHHILAALALVFTCASTFAHDENAGIHNESKATGQEPCCYLLLAANDSSRREQQEAELRRKEYLHREAEEAEARRERQQAELKRREYLRNEAEEAEARRERQQAELKRREYLRNEAQEAEARREQQQAELKRREHLRREAEEPDTNRHVTNMQNQRGRETARCPLTEKGQQATDHATEKRERRDACEQNAIKEICNSDTPVPRLGMTLAQVQACFGSFRLVGNWSESEGRVSALVYRAGQYHLFVINGHVVKWY